MTIKQENILKAALELFAERGYNGTSTSKIAKKAGVSEGLIFRHFENKKGLLDAIIKLGEEKAYLFLNPILNELIPEKLIRGAIELPFAIPVEEHNFWRLQFKVKWEVGYYDAAKEKIMDGKLQKVLENAFKKMTYPQPKLEADYLIFIIEAIFGAILQGTLKNPTAMKRFLLGKYFP